jgi:hypothetical protein
VTDVQVTYRPVAARIVSIVGGVCLTAVMLVMWFAFSAEVREGFRTIEVATLLAFLAGALAILWGIARTKVTYDDLGILVRNGFRVHELAWTDVDDMRLDRGMAWVTMRTSAGKRVFVIAVQSADGDRAVAQLRQMRARAIEAGGLAGGRGTGQGPTG